MDKNIVPIQKHGSLKPSALSGGFFICSEHLTCNLPKYVLDIVTPALLETTCPQCVEKEHGPVAPSPDLGKLPLTGGPAYICSNCFKVATEVLTVENEACKDCLVELEFHENVFPVDCTKCGCSLFVIEDDVSTITMCGPCWEKC